MSGREGLLRRGARWAGHLCRLLLAGVLLAAGGLKALDPGGLATETAQYGILPQALIPTFATLLIIAEIVVGVALLLNYRSVASLGAAAALFALFIGAISFALATGKPLEGCGCFGRTVPRTPQQTLVEDLLLLGAALAGMALLRWAGTASVRLPGRLTWKGATVGLVAVTSSAFVLASPHLPLDDFATRIGPGVRWADLGVALAEVDLSRGAHLVALMGMADPATAAALPGMNALATAGTPIVGLHADEDEVYNQFFWTQGPAFSIYRISAPDFRPMYRRLPRYFALKDGVVAATWDNLPAASEAGEVLK